MGLQELFGGSSSSSRPACPPHAAKARPKPRGAAAPASGAKRKGACLRPPVAAVQSSKSSSGWPVCHMEPSQTCAQCRFQRFREQWVRLYGSHETLVHGRRARTEWLGVRPAAWGSNWAVGCSVCARLLFRMGLTGKEAGSRKRKWSTKFGRYEVSGLSAMQAETFKTHARSEIHRVALRAWAHPEQPVSRLCEEPDETRLFQGHVPQLTHWASVWRFAKTPTSYRGAEMLQRTQTFLSTARCGEQGLKRKAAASMVRIMHEVVRECKRAILRRASAITVSLDDRGSFRVVRFRCVALGVFETHTPACPAGIETHAAACPRPDVETPVAACPRADIETHTAACPSGDIDATLAKRMLVSGTTCVFTGIVAVLRRGGCASTETLEDLQEDYSIRMRDSVMLAINALCTSITGHLDTALAHHVRAHILTYLSDGGAPAIKCGKLMQDICPNMVLILRDTAHAMRKTCEDPIKHAEGFGKFWEDIFGGKKALVPDIQNSEAWQAKLLMAQRHVLACKGSQGGGLKAALRHLSFAKQRFDSAACPARKFCALLSSIAILLATVAADPRVDPNVRRRAQAHLDSLTPERIAVAGMFADYAAEVLKFVRRFDCSEHDPAHTHRQAKHFLRRMKLLFAEGHVLVDLPPGSPGETCATMAVTQAKEFGKLYYMDRCIELWPPNARSGVERALASMKDVVSAVADRVGAEFQKDSLQMQFAAFDLRLWHLAMSLKDSGNRNDAEIALNALRRRVRALIAAHPFSHGPSESMVRSFETVVTCLRQAFRDKVKSESGAHNKELWSLVLTNAVPNAEPSADVRRILEWYLSVTDSTGNLERNLGRMVQVLDVHNHIFDEDGRHLSALIELDLDGPASEEEIARKVVVAARFGDVTPAGDTDVLLLERALTPEAELVLKATPFTHRCAELWLAHHARRFGCYKKRSAVVRGPRPATDAAVARGQKRALDTLFRNAEATGVAERRTVLGVSRAKLIAGAGRVSIDARRLAKFRKLTAAKLAAQQVVNQRRRSGLKAYPRPPLRRGPCCGIVPAPPLPSGGAPMRCLNACRAALPSNAAYHVTPMLSSAGGLWRQISAAQLVVVDRMADVEQPADSRGVSIMLCVIALGKLVALRAAVELAAASLRSGRRYAAAISCEQAIAISPGFSEKHTHVTALLQRCVDMKDSKWTMVTAERADSIRTLADVVAFMRRARRFPFRNGVHLESWGRGA